jgi:hypothetical protein
MRQRGFPDARGLHGLTLAAPTRSRCRLLALFGHSKCTDERPLLGVRSGGDAGRSLPQSGYQERSEPGHRAGLMAAGDRDPIHLPVNPASATAMRQIYGTSAHLRNARHPECHCPPARGYPAFCVLKMER